MSETTNNSECTVYCIELRTSQWENLVRWYQTVVGLQVLVRVVDDKYALLDGGGTHLAIMSRKQPGEASSRWSLAFEVKNIAETSNRLTEAGLAVEKPQLAPEGFLVLATQDPDGNRIRFFEWPKEGRSSGRKPPKV